VLRKAFRVDRGRGDDDLEIGPGGQQPLQVAEDEVDVQAALVCLVDDQGVVTQQPPVLLHLGQQDAVGHHLDERVVTGLVGEPHLVADHGTDLGAQLVGDPLRHGPGRDPPGLGVADLAGDAAAKLQADLRQLRGLPRAGLARDDDHLVIADGRGDLVLALADRQPGRIGNDGHRAPARLGPGRGRLQFGDDLAECLLARSRVAQRGGILHAAAQTALIARHQLGQARSQLGRRGRQGNSLHNGTREPALRMSARSPDC
jgi:hypothetical protein